MKVYIVTVIDIEENDAYSVAFNTETTAEAFRSKMAARLENVWHLRLSDVQVLEQVGPDEVDEAIAGFFMDDEDDDPPGDWQGPVQ